ncbi:MAG: hypothetical protein EPO22_04970 [Dehalococcoidia bacterium]|nr:MAG: hypothetical protein EPO22_04970 [Dehalococcoidia bacterium]
MIAAVDPSRAEEVGPVLLEYVRRRLDAPSLAYAEAPQPLGRSTSSFIYAFRLADAPAGWTAPLVARIVLGEHAGPTLQREAAIQRFVAGHGYRTLDILASEATRDTELGLPFTVAERIMGGTLLDAVKRAPLAMPRLLAEMADAHLALHRIPVDGCPLPYDAPLVERRLEDWHRRLHFEGAEELRRGLAWLQDNAASVRQEEPAICHNDFHPLNILRDGGGQLVVIDWSEAALGDRNCDVARTAALFWFAPLGASSAAERVLLWSLRGFLRGRYLAAYRLRQPVDGERLRYWEAAHAFNGWLQMVELGRRGAAAPELQLEMVRQELTPRVREGLRRYFWHCTLAG